MIQGYISGSCSLEMLLTQLQVRDQRMECYLPLALSRGVGSRNNRIKIKETSGKIMTGFNFLWPGGWYSFCLKKLKRMRGRCSGLTRVVAEDQNATEAFRSTAGAEDYVRPGALGATNQAWSWLLVILWVLHVFIAEITWSFVRFPAFIRAARGQTFDSLAG